MFFNFLLATPAYHEDVLNCGQFLIMSKYRWSFHEETEAKPEHKCSNSQCEDLLKPPTNNSGDIRV